MTRPNVVPVILLALLASTAGCSLFSEDSSPSDTSITNVNVIENLQRFDRSTIQIDGFEIGNANVEGDLLKLRVSYSGGCDDHAFELYSTHGIYRSNPPQADVYLSHDGNGDACRSLITEELRFDLSPLQRATDPGAVYLRLHQYKAAEPITPMPLYEYR